jgi:membrane dipeptidase
MTSAVDLHRDAIIVDAVCPLAHNSFYLDWYREGGFTLIGPTVSTASSAEDADATLGRWHRLLRERDDIVLVSEARALEACKRNGRLGIFFHFQGADAIGADLDLVDLYKALGVGVVQLTYNVKSRVGDGCEEPHDGGLSRFGARLIERLNCARVIVDCSHTGERTSLDAVAAAVAPVVISHANARAKHQSARNVSDDLIRAIAGTGGLIGAVGFPAMVSADRRPTLDQFIDHIAYIADLVGIDHAGLGIDYYSGQAGVASDEDALAFYRAAQADGMWSAAYPPPPHHYPAGIETPRRLLNLTARLLERGFSADDTRKVLGANWLRVMNAVWG